MLVESGGSKPPLWTVAFARRALAGGYVPTGIVLTLPEPGSLAANLAATAPAASEREREPFYATQQPSRQGEGFSFRGPTSRLYNIHHDGAMVA